MLPVGAANAEAVWRMAMPSAAPPRRARFNVFWHTTLTGVNIIRRAVEPSWLFMSSKYFSVTSSCGSRTSRPGRGAGSEAQLGSRRAPFSCSSVHRSFTTCTRRVPSAADCRPKTAGNPRLIGVSSSSAQLLFYAEMNSLFFRCCQAPSRKAWRRNYMISGCWRTGASLVGGPERSK